MHLPGTLTNWSEKARLATELADGAAIKLYPTLKSSTFSCPTSPGPPPILKIFNRYQ